MNDFGLIQTIDGFSQSVIIVGGQWIQQSPIAMGTCHGVLVPDVPHVHELLGRIYLICSGSILSSARASSRPGTIRKTTG